MSQSQVSDFSIDPTVTTGTQLAQILNRLSDADITCHSGAARPPYAKVGTIWLDTSTPPGTLYWFDGVIDNPLIKTGHGLDHEYIQADHAGQLDKLYLTDTKSNTVNITLPSGAAKDRVGFKDYSGTFDTNNLTITPAAGENIEGHGTPLIIDNQGWSGILEYVDATKGWMLVESSPMGAWAQGGLMPVGGATGQALIKRSATDLDASWQALPPSLPTGGATGEALVKKSATDGDAEWKQVTQPFMQVQDQKPAGTEGGASVAGFNDRVLNTVVVNEITGASLTTNAVTLPAGKYYIEAMAHVFKGAHSNTCIRDSANKVLLNMGNPFSIHTAAADGACDGHVAGRIDLAATTAIKLTSEILVANATGLGRHGKGTLVEVFSDLRIWQLST